jgi:DNA ligase 1
MLRFAETCEAVAQTSSKLEKISLVASYLGELGDSDLEAAARFFTGSPLPQREQRALAVGGSTLVAAARSAWHFDDASLAAAYRAHGDLGSALAAVFHAPLDLGLFRAPLSPHRLSGLLEEIAATSGRASSKRRQVLCEQILTSCETPLEAKYAVKVLTGDLRIGLREGLVVDAIACAFGRDPRDVRRAVSAAGDIGAVARSARGDTLASVEIAYGSPIAFMLATPIPYGEYRELQAQRWLVEDKFDGIRVQAHKAGATIKLFSRTLKDSAPAFPEIVEALAKLADDVILDGELIAERAGRVLPFRYLQTRLQRKDVSAELLAGVPVAFVVFDVLARGRTFLIDAPLVRRREALARTVPREGVLRYAEAAPLEPGAPPARVEALFAAARERGNEGLVFKRLDAAYVPGKRGKWWLKLKRELSTLDVAVVAVEWGHGKRAGVLSDYTFAVRGENGDLVTIGKAYSGLTDTEIAEMTQWFLAHRLGEAQGHRIPVVPVVVIEVAFDVIQKSGRHQSGYSLRFPRIVRLRPDKPVSEIDSIQTVESIYATMLEREGVVR